MDFYDKLIEVNQQLADALDKLHSLNVFSSKKQFTSAAKKLLALANESRRDKVLYEKFMEMAIFALSSSGLDKKELEKLFGSIMPYKYLKLVTCQDQFTSKNQKPDYADFNHHLDLIFKCAPFVPKAESVERIRNLFKKFNMPDPINCAFSLCKI